MILFYLFFLFIYFLFLFKKNISIQTTRIFYKAKIYAAFCKIKYCENTAYYNAIPILSIKEGNKKSHTCTQNVNIQTIQKKLSLATTHQVPFEMKFSVH